MDQMQELDHAYMALSNAVKLLRKSKVNSENWDDAMNAIRFNLETLEDIAFEQKYINKASE